MTKAFTKEQLLLQSRDYHHKCFEIKERKGFKFCLVPTGSIRVEKYEDARIAMS